MVQQKQQDVVVRPRRHQMRPERHLGGQVERRPGQLRHVGAPRVPTQHRTARVIDRQHLLTQVAEQGSQHRVPLDHRRDRPGQGSLVQGAA